MTPYPPSQYPGQQQHQQNQQQYNPYNYYQQPQPEPHKSSGLKLIVVILLLIISIAGVAVYSFRGREPVNETPKSPKNTGTTSNQEDITKDGEKVVHTSLGITKLVLLEKFVSMDDYITRRVNQYNYGDHPQVLAVYNMKSDTKTENEYQFDADFGFNLRGPNGVQIAKKDNFYHYETTEPVDLITIPILYSFYFMPEDKTGAYTIEIIATDNLNGEISSKETNVVLVK